MLRIAVIGPESSGKSTLAKFIADKFHALLVEEYAREYLLNKTDPSKYSINDLIIIANEQFNRTVNLQVPKNNILVCDTEMLTIKIWAEDKFYHCPKEVNNLFYQQKFDLYILCKPDIKWEYDILREDEDRRDYIFNIYLDYCINNKFNYVEIEGDMYSRTKKIINILKQLNY